MAPCMSGPRPSEFARRTPPEHAGRRAAVASMKCKRSFDKPFELAWLSVCAERSNRVRAGCVKLYLCAEIGTIDIYVQASRTMKPGFYDIYLPKQNPARPVCSFPAAAAAAVTSFLIQTTWERQLSIQARTTSNNLCHDTNKHVASWASLVKSPREEDCTGTYVVPYSRWGQHVQGSWRR